MLRVILYNATIKINITTKNDFGNLLRCVMPEIC